VKGKKSEGKEYAQMITSEERSMSRLVPAN